MYAQIKEKIKLNRVSHSVRAAQAILQYGVGAMVDFPDQTLVTAAPKYWGRTKRIFDERFAASLGVDYFVIPEETADGLAYARFPEWYFCPKCRKFQPLEKWISEHKRVAKNDDNIHMVRNLKCSKCRQDLVVARIVTVCENGHLNDFPWIEWVHRRSKKEICGNPELQFKTGASGSEGLEGLSLSCSCGARSTLSGAFEKDCFSKLDENLILSEFRCQGNHPYKHTKEKCSLYPRTVQRGASSVYFPLVYSSLVIPPYSDKLTAKIMNSQEFDKCLAIIDDEDPEDRIPKIRKKLSKWCENISMEIGVPVAEIEKFLTRKWLEPENDVHDVNEIGYRIDEYMALSGEVGTESLGDFSRTEMNVEEYSIPFVKSVSLIDKIRVVKALVGFSRLNPVTNKFSKGFVDIKDKDAKSYPAYEVRGEGIFIEFDMQSISEWIEKNPVVVDRISILNRNYAASYLGHNHPRTVTPKFVLLHTLSHLLISQLSFVCGYSIASLGERLYCAEKEDGKEMAGIFIYTASGDSEGTLGGLVRQGRPDTLPKVFKKAIRSAKTCSNDPVCIMSRGQGRDSLNLAACHACALLPETCCEESNSFLDRGLIIGTYDDPEIGFWNAVEI